MAVQPLPNALLPDTDSPRLPPLEGGRPVGGSMLNREQPGVRQSSGASGQSPVQPSAPPEVFPVEPPVINQR